MIDGLQLTYKACQVLQRERCTIGQADRALEILLTRLEDASPSSKFAAVLFDCVARRVAQRRTFVYNLARFAEEAIVDVPIERFLLSREEYQTSRCTKQSIEKAVLGFVQGSQSAPLSDHAYASRPTSSSRNGVLTSTNESDIDLKRILHPVRRVRVDAHTDVDVTTSAVSSHLTGYAHSLIADIDGVLSALQPTSAGVERTFSLLSGVQTKYQGRMKDEKFRTTLFLRHIHMQQNIQDLVDTLDKLDTSDTASGNRSRPGV